MFTTVVFFCPGSQVFSFEPTSRQLFDFDDVGRLPVCFLGVGNCDKAIRLALEAFTIFANFCNLTKPMFQMDYRHDPTQPLYISVVIKGMF